MSRIHHRSDEWNRIRSVDRSKPTCPAAASSQSIRRTWTAPSSSRTTTFVGQRSPWTSVSGPPRAARTCARSVRSEEHTSELQSLRHLVCRLLLEKKKKNKITHKRTGRNH